MVQVKGVMLLSQPNPEKHRPAKPFGKTIRHNNFTHQRNTYAALRKKHGTTAFQPFLVLNKAANRQEGEIHT